MNIKKQIRNLSSKEAWLVNQAIENICLYGSIKDLEQAIQVAKQVKIKQDLFQILETQYLLDVATAKV